MNPLKKARGKAKLTVRQLAKKSGVNVNTISYLENYLQQARTATIAKLAEALNVPFEDLESLADQEIRKPESPNLIAA